MESYDIQRLREFPIESVAERLGLKVERHKALCPFHDDSNPSLSFSVSRNTFKCFVCDAHGGVIDLAMKVLGKGFRETCQWLADEHNVILEEWKPVEKPINYKPSTFNPQKYVRFFEKPFINQLAGEFLFEKRHIDPRVVRWCKLTSWKNWLQIPYFDIEGNLIGVQWRNLGNEGPRFRFPHGSNCHIYNLPVLKMLRPGEELWITEGVTDCMAMLSSGRKAIAIPSATLLKQDDVELLKRLSSSACPEHVEGLSLNMFPDQDAPGERLYLQLKELLPNLIHHQLPSGYKDYGAYWASK